MEKVIIPKIKYDRGSFIVIKYSVESTLKGMHTGWEWAVWKAEPTPKSWYKRNPLCKPYTKQSFILTREQAMEIIKTKGLVLAEQNRYGKVYDTPEHDFQQRYKGQIYL